MACFCSCTIQAWDECESKEWVDEWWLSYLNPLDMYQPLTALELTEMESSVDFDHISDLVQPGNISTCIVFEIPNVILLCSVFEMLTNFIQFATHINVRHVYVVIVDEDNEEGTDYYLCHCVEAKKQLKAPVMSDGKNIKYPTGSVVVTGTWIRRCPHKSVNVWLFQDFDTHRKIPHYSNLIVASNVQLIQYRGRPLNKTLWKVSESDHEAILDTIKSRADSDGSLD